MTEDKKDEINVIKLQFQNKDEITRAIAVLTPFALPPLEQKSVKFDFALDKIKELTKLL